MSLSSEYSRFFKRARTRLPGAIDDQIRLELFAVLDEFFKESNAWWEEIRVPVITTKLAYEFESDEPAAQIIRLLKTYTADDVAVKAIMPTPGVLEIAYAPSQNLNYYALVSLTVSDPVDDDGYPVIPDWVMLRYRETIMDGTLANMMAQVNKPYSSERMAVYHARRFRNGIGVARAEALRRNMYAYNAWRFPSFAV